MSESRICIKIPTDTLMSYRFVIVSWSDKILLVINWLKVRSARRIQTLVGKNIVKCLEQSQELWIMHYFIPFYGTSEYSPEFCTYICLPLLMTVCYQIGINLSTINCSQLWQDGFLFSSRIFYLSEQIDFQFVPMERISWWFIVLLVRAGASVRGSNVQGMSVLCVSTSWKLWITLFSNSTDM